jgi:hypothetical protein
MRGVVQPVGDNPERAGPRIPAECVDDGLREVLIDGLKSDTLDWFRECL